jgi:asparagine synthetase B (glutamine-hydrolysing)
MACFVWEDERDFRRSAFGVRRFGGSAVRRLAVSERDLERMGNVLAHRGADGRKAAVDAAVGLGHCLMRVNQEDLFERQSLKDRDADLTLVADCRIDNRDALAEAFGLSAADTRDIADSAFILRAYKTILMRFIAQRIPEPTRPKRFERPGFSRYGGGGGRGGARRDAAARA